MARPEQSAIESSPDETGRPPRATGWAWGICWLMFASTMLNYMDRQTLAQVSPQIMGEFHLNNAEFGWVLAAFSMSYALFQVPAGYLVDRLNVRWAYAAAVGWWSLAGMAVTLSPSLGVLMVLRALLGMGESFNWPSALRVTRTILPPADRSLGNGIFNSGAALGAVITPLTVEVLSQVYGWRKSFLLVGTLGFVWVVAWLLALRGKHRLLFAGRRLEPPRVDSPTPRSRLSTPARLGFGGVATASVAVASLSYRFGLSAIWLAIALFMVGILLAALALPLSALEGMDWAVSLGAVVRSRRFWVLMVVSVSINVCWHFLLNWLPTYIRKDLPLPEVLMRLAEDVGRPLARGLSWVFGTNINARSVGVSLVITYPFLAADFGNLLGGMCTRVLAGRGFTPVRARQIVMAGCTLVISSGAWVGKAHSALVAINLLALMAMGTAAFMANYFSFAQEASTRHTGLIVGVLGAFGNLFAAGFLPFAGAVKDATGGFTPIFVLVGLMPFVGLTTLCLGWGDGRADSNSS